MGASAEKEATALGVISLLHYGSSLSEGAPFYKIGAMSRTLISFLLLTVVALVAGAGLFFREYGRVFPPLAPGLYAGFIKPASKGEPFAWLVEVPPNSSEVLVSVGSPLFPAQRALVTEPSRTTRLPLIISGEGRRLRLAGDVLENMGARGEYSDPISGEGGTWTLERVGLAEFGKEGEAGLSAWGVAWSVGSLAEAKAESVRLRIGEIKGRVTSLKEELSGRQSLKSLNADPVVKPALPDDKESREVTAKKGELDAILKNIDTSNKVSPAGKLVLMSRESIQREAAWIENALDLTAPEASADFDSKYERALKVKALQDQIADERGLLRNLLESPSTRREGVEINEEEAFYNGLQ